MGTTVVFRHDGWSDDDPALDDAKVSYTQARVVGALNAFTENARSLPFLK